ncbi:hypothetical protein MXB_297 [Myxobolus squamalis]|nr:hypothetical protein MXB_297 [Myxobolus squamalis]
MNSVGLYSIIRPNKRAHFSSLIKLLSLDVTLMSCIVLFSSVYWLINEKYKKWKYDHFLIQATITFVHCTIFYSSYCYLRRKIKLNGHFTYCSRTSLYYMLHLQIKTIGFVVQAIFYLLIKITGMSPSFIPPALSAILAVHLICCISLSCFLICIHNSQDCDAEKFLKSITDPSLDVHDNHTCLNSLGTTQWRIIQYLRRRMNNLVQTSVSVTNDQ